MPIAFFTRTRTGALVSRLNNDVIGAQRAFSDTLSGVVSNLVTLLLTLVVMIQLSWQITLLTLVLLPLFVVLFLVAPVLCTFAVFADYWI